MKLRDVVLLLVTVFLFISCGSSHEEHTHGDAHDHIHAVHKIVMVILMMMRNMTTMTMMMVGNKR